MNVENVRERLAKKIKDHLLTLDGVTAQVSAYVLTSPTGPFIQVFPGPANHNNSFHRGHEQRDFMVQIAAPLSADIGAQKKLDALISANAIPEALSVEASDDPWEDINVESDTGYTKFEKDGSAPLLGVEYTVRVYG